MILHVNSVIAACDPPECTLDTECGMGERCVAHCCKPGSNAAPNNNPFGTINPPVAVSGDPGTGIGNLIQRIIWVLIIGAGIYALFNFILAGYAFLSAGDDPKKVAGAWAKIWQTALGLVVAAAAFVLAAIFGQLIFGRWDFILNPTIPTL